MIASLWNLGTARGEEVTCRRPQQLSRLRAGLLVAYLRYFQWRHGFVGHVLQGRFKGPAIDAECYLLSCGRSSERNPVAANLTQDAWEYPWSWKKW